MSQTFISNSGVGFMLCVESGCWLSLVKGDFPTTDNLGDLLRIRRIYNIPETIVRELWGEEGSG